MLLQKNSLHFRSVSPPCREVLGLPEAAPLGGAARGWGSCLGRRTSQLVSHGSLIILLLQVRLFRFFQVFQVLGWRGRTRGHPLGQDGGKPGPSTRALPPSWPCGQKQTTLVSTRGREGASRQQDGEGSPGPQPSGSVGPGTAVRQLHGVLPWQACCPFCPPST